MKIYHILSILFISLLIACNSTPTLEKMSDKDYVKLAVKNNFPSPDSIILRDITGKVLTTQQMISMYEAGGFTTDFYKNKSGAIVEAVVRRSTPADQRLEAEINQKLNSGPPVSITDIACDKISPLLEEAFRRDQEIRKSEELYDEIVDHKNIELVVSIDEKCGLPKGVENEREISIIWAIVQHNRAQFRKRYINYFVEANENNALDPASIALMQDRILMDDGKPQIYGSQLMNGTLYNLRDAANVDKRRASVGLGPLSDYLDKFGVSFDIEQK